MAMEMVGNGDGNGNGSPPVDDRCSVCHDDFNLPCRTSCSHWFCGECILRVWLHGDPMQPCMCPLCNSLFTTLSPFHPAFPDGPQAQQIMEHLTRYNRLHAGGLRGFFHKILDLPFLVRMGIRVMMMDPDSAISQLSRARIIIAVKLLLGMAVFLIPLDYLPPDNMLHLLNFCVVAFVIIMRIIAWRRARRTP